jgi:hypothetical protein
MQKLDAHRTGLVFAALMFSFHLCWLVLVAVGWAQPLMDFIFWMHHIQPVYVVRPFNPTMAALLLGFTTLVGYVSGNLGASLWNVLREV